MSTRFESNHGHMCVCWGEEYKTIAVPGGKMSELFIGLSMKKQAIISPNRGFFFQLPEHLVTTERPLNGK